MFPNMSWLTLFFLAAGLNVFIAAFFSLLFLILAGLFMPFIIISLPVLFFNQDVQDQIAEKTITPFINDTLEPPELDVGDYFQDAVEGKLDDDGDVTVTTLTAKGLREEKSGEDRRRVTVRMPRRRRTEPDAIKLRILSEVDGNTVGDFDLDEFSPPFRRPVDKWSSDEEDEKEASDKLSSLRGDKTEGGVKIKERQNKVRFDRDPVRRVHTDGDIIGIKAQNNMASFFPTFKMPNFSTGNLGNLLPNVKIPYVNAAQSYWKNAKDKLTPKKEHPLGGKENLGGKSKI